MNEKIIFLDVDGVLNNANTPTRTKSGCLFVDEGKIRFLQQIVEATEAKIVLSSTWRYDREEPLYNGDYLELQEALAAVGLHFYSFTPEEASGLNRGREIQAWLAEHPETERFVILDDEWFDFRGCGLKEHVVKTNFCDGLTEDLAQQAIELLMR